MTPASRWLRRAEIALWVIGSTLLGVALGAILHRWNFQAEQERVLVRSAAASQLTSRPGELATPATSAELPGTEREGARRQDRNDEELHETKSSSDPSETVDSAPEPPEGTAETKSSSVTAETIGAAAEPEEIGDALPGLMGRIEIPRLGLRAIVSEGEDESTLRRAVGYLVGTAYPGEGGNTALAAHRDTFFRPLRRIRMNDEIRLIVPPHTYEYRVDSIRVVEPDEVSVLESTGTEELTLITCYPFGFIGPAPDRFVVKATRVQ